MEVLSKPRLACAAVAVPVAFATDGHLPGCRDYPCWCPANVSDKEATLEEKIASFDREFVPSCDTDGM